MALCAGWRLVHRASLAAISVSRCSSDLLIFPCACRVSASMMSRFLQTMMATTNHMKAHLAHPRPKSKQRQTSASGGGLKRSRAQRGRGCSGRFARQPDPRHQPGDYATVSDAALHELRRQPCMPW